MNCPAIVPFSRRPLGTGRDNVSLTNLLTRIDRACQSLVRADLSVISFGGSTFDGPVVVVAAHPRVYAHFSGRYARKAFRHEGALRHETWEATDSINHVRVRWEEVIPCGV